ncbi:hypothetical protein FACS18942_08740 [Planctomycetales bacterium]|nr:hypothetical protein FACS18942_08740 [Planctomycetales bacterium]GHT37582.1 hypothetical protein FACS189427_10710 [Planctomycetales bacterium]
MYYTGHGRKNGTDDLFYTIKGNDNISKNDIKQFLERLSVRYFIFSDCCNIQNTSKEKSTEKSAPKGVALAYGAVHISIVRDNMCPSLEEISPTFCKLFFGKTKNIDVCAAKPDMPAIIWISRKETIFSKSIFELFENPDIRDWQTIKESLKEICNKNFKEYCKVYGFRNGIPANSLLFKKNVRVNLPTGRMDNHAPYFFD